MAYSYGNMHLLCIYLSGSDLECKFSKRLRRLRQFEYETLQSALAWYSVKLLPTAEAIELERCLNS